MKKIIFLLLFALVNSNLFSITLNVAPAVASGGFEVHGYHSSGCPLNCNNDAKKYKFEFSNPDPSKGFYVTSTIEDTTYQIDKITVKSYNPNLSPTPQEITFDVNPFATYNVTVENHAIQLTQTVIKPVF